MKLAFNLLKFEDVKEEVIKYLNEFSPYAIKNGGQFDFSSSNLSNFVNSMAYTNMLMNYNISNITNNIFLDTVENRNLAVSRVKDIGYTPKRPYSSKIVGKLIYKGVNFNENTSLTIYPRSPFLGSFGNLYYNMEPIELTCKTNPTILEGNYVLAQGTFKYSITYADGTPNFSFKISNPNIDEEHFSLFVVPQSVAIQNGLIDTPSNINNFLEFKWSMIKTFNDAFDSKYYYLEEDIIDIGCPKIVFNNGSLNSSLNKDDVIIVEYFETKGTAANNENLISLPPTNVQTGTVNNYLYYNTTRLSIENNFSLNNFDNASYQNIYNKSFGGHDIESLDEIKINAPKFYSNSGKAITKNDYFYTLSTISGIGSYYAIGGDELYPNDITKLGNIYICVTPNIISSEFLNNNNIYILSSQEQYIDNKLSNVSVLSTKRIYKTPSYILVEVIPKIELIKNISLLEQNKIKTQVKLLTENYFSSKYTKLAESFRESKISIDIDSLNYVVSSNFDLFFYFIINNNTVENIQAGVNDIINLPVINVKDNKGNVIGTTNFIRTNSEIIKKELFGDIDWSILNKAYDTLSESDKILYKNKIRLYNKYQQNLKPEQSALYSSSGLINNNLYRYVYNKDYAIIKIADLKITENNQLDVVTYNYKDNNKRDVIVKVYESYVNALFTRTINLSCLDVDVPVSKGVATIKIKNSEITLEISEQQKNDLVSYFGIDESRYIFNINGKSSPFNIVNNNGIYSIYMEANLYNSQLVLNSKNDILNVSVNNNILTPNQINDKITNWTLETINNTYSKIKIDGTLVGILENSHNEITNGYKFKGFLNSLSFSTLSPSNYQNGDYFIISEVVYNHIADVYYYPNDIIYVKNNTIFKSEIKKSVSTSTPELLKTNYNRGDIYLNNSGSYIIYDPYTQSTKPIILKDSASYSVDASVFLPKSIKANQMIKTVVDSVNNVNGVQVNYPNTFYEKISRLYRKALDGTWEILPDNKVYNGDLLVYSMGNTNMLDSWYLLENTDNLLNRINAPVIATHDITSLSTGIFDIFYVDQNVLITNEDDFRMFINLSSDNILYAGDYIICIESPSDNYNRGRWQIFDNDYYDYQIDVVNSASQFPIPLTVGDCFYTYVSDTTITNFNGQTNTEIYNEGDRILYIGNDEWKKYETNNVPIYSNILTANIGDLIQVTDEGTFNNDSHLDVPLYNDGTNTNMKFDYYDILYFTGSAWIKAFPYRIYTEASQRSFINSYGLNSDIFINQETSDSFTIYAIDIYHNTVIGELDYYTGELVLKSKIDQNLNKTQILKNISTLSDIFKYTNYNNNTRQMDMIQFKPTYINSNTLSRDFDTTFNQFILANVLETQLI